MTFSHGDYCQLEEIKNPDEIACNLYRQAIDYYPDHRAYLGLGIIYQKEGRYKKSVKILTTGLKYFPYSDQLGICLGVSLMNQGLIKDAQACFERFPDSPQARSYASACKRM
jgi:tetratricopeptide (TPR) repeat protein